MKADVIIQARTGSTRLPGKVMMDLCGKPVLQQILERIGLCRRVGRIVVATTVLAQDDVIEQFCSDKGYAVYRGSSDDVLDRYYNCAKKYNADHIVRMTADNALFDPAIVDQGIDYYFAADKDYVYYREGLPLGTAVEIFRHSALEKAWAESSDPASREHVTAYMYRNPDRFVCERAHSAGPRHDDLRLTMDTEQDYQLVRNIYDGLYSKDRTFTLEDVYLLLEQNPAWRELNASVVQKKV